MPHDIPYKSAVTAAECKSHLNSKDTPSISLVVDLHCKEIYKSWLGYEGSSSQKALLIG